MGIELHSILILKRDISVKPDISPLSQIVLPEILLTIIKINKFNNTGQRSDILWSEYQLKSFIIYSKISI